MRERNKMWHAELIDSSGLESSVCLLAKNEAEARERLWKYGERDEIVSIGTSIMVAFAEVRGELGEIYYWRTKKVKED